VSKIKIYVKSILIPVAVGGIVGLLLSRFIDYNILQKPTLAPPSYFFPIVWTILYILMGVSYGRLKEKNLVVNNINAIYYLQLVVNALWPIFFFIFKWRLFSVFWIIFLCVLIIYMIIKFYKKDNVSGLLQIPYLLWSIFATYLNIGIFLLNS